MIRRAVALAAVASAMCALANCGDSEERSSYAERVRMACYAALRSDADVVDLETPGARLEVFERAHGDIVAFQSELAELAAPTDGDDVEELERLVVDLRETEEALAGLVEAERSGDADASRAALATVQALHEHAVEADVLGTGDCISGRPEDGSRPEPPTNR